MLTEPRQLIAGPSGSLEIAIAKALHPRIPTTWGVICHPHSLFGGTMNNKVVSTLVKAFQALGVHTVRFNFRGVGQSEGVYDHGDGELDDLFAVINWLKQEQGELVLWLGGFSFGAFVAAKAAAVLSPACLVTVAPPVENFPMQVIPAIDSCWVVVQGDADEVVPAQAVIDWAEQRMPKPRIIRFAESGHFFHGKLTELRDAIVTALTIS